MTITGTGFSGATAVDFGRHAGDELDRRFSDTLITATSPAGTGMVDVTVTTRRRHLAPPRRPTSSPTWPVTGVSPTAGPLTGGTTVTITGRGFTGATAVDFGGSSSPATASSRLRDGDHGHEPRGHGHGGRDGDRPWRHVGDLLGRPVHLRGGADGVRAQHRRQGLGRRHGGDDHGQRLHRRDGGGFRQRQPGHEPGRRFGDGDHGQEPGGIDRRHGGRDSDGPGGTSVTSSADQFSYVAAPTVSGVSPAGRRPVARW